MMTPYEIPLFIDSEGTLHFVELTWADEIETTCIMEAAMAMYFKLDQ